MQTPKLTESAENAVHDALRKVAQNVLDQHKICLRNVQFSWININAINEVNMRVDVVETETLTKA